MTVVFSLVVSSEVLLVTSSFMSPTESRAGTNTNRVRIFSPNQLVKATAQEKWDRVKIVCSQPYSKVRLAPAVYILCEPVQMPQTESPDRDRLCIVSRATMFCCFYLFIYLFVCLFLYIYTSPRLI